jgi:hypothetical protein
MTARAAGLVGTAGSRFWAKAADRPVDSFAIFAAGAASLIIIVNAIFLQSGSHPAPFFATPAPPPPVSISRAQPAELDAGKSDAANKSDALKQPDAAKPAEVTGSAHAPALPRAAGGVRRNDPIGDLISGSSSRITAIQRALAEFGYGQIKPSGTLDEPTSAAIERFEREHKLPVTGRGSDRLVSDLSAMTGRPLN